MLSKIIWGVLLSFNVISITMFMFQHDASAINYGSIFGCVIFGAWIVKEVLP